MRAKRVILNTVLVILLIGFCILLLRNFSSRQVDDVSPAIACDSGIIGKSETLMVIPIFQNKSIAEDSGWCKYILSLNKTLGMHGVYHNYREFGELRNEDYIRAGMKEFRKCFGRYPEIFEAPQVSLSRENGKTLRAMGFEVRGYPFQIMHKVYHCNDTGKYSNKFVDWV